MTGASPLLPRRVLFSKPDPAEIALSPDGYTLAWLGDDAGIRRVFVALLRSAGRARVLSAGTPGVSQALFWAGNHHLIVFRDADGDENYRAFALHVATGAERPLTAPGARALFVRCASASPETVVFMVNDVDPSRFDLVRVDVTTGSTARIFENTSGYSRIHVDGSLQLTLAEEFGSDGGLDLLLLNGECWSPLRKIELGDVLASRVVAVTDRAAFLIDSTGRNTAALVRLDLETGATRIIASDEVADIEAVVLSQPDGQPVAAASTLHLRRWHAVDPSFASVLAILKQRAGEGQFEILDVCAGAHRVSARIEQGDCPAENVILDVTAGAEFTSIPLRNRPPGGCLRPMEPVTIRARDGLPLRSYLTRPGSASVPVPLVLVVHGGPYDRDRWGYSSTHQWLANRGCAALSVNFRGSTGFGKSFVNAADREWGGRMQADLADAVDWAIACRIADPRRVAVMGSSYGGYAALMAAARHPDKFCCVASIGGPTSLADFVDAIPPYWHSWFSTIRQRLADPATAVGRSWLDERSPLLHVPDIRCPVLMVHGQHDVRVPLSQAREMTAALAAAEVDATLAVFPDEGHFIGRDANLIGLMALIEAFLAGLTGCAVEDVSRDLGASSLRIESGGAFLAAPVLSDLHAAENTPGAVSGGVA